MSLGPSCRLKNLKDIDKWSPLSLCFSVREMSVISVLYSTLNPVVHGDIVLSINTNTSGAGKSKIIFPSLKVTLFKANMACGE